MAGNSTPAVRRRIFKAFFDAVPKDACHQTPVWAGTTVTTDEPGTVRNAEGEQDRCSCQGERSSEPGKSGHQAGTANSGSHGKGGSAVHPHPHLENSGCGRQQRLGVNASKVRVNQPPTCSLTSSPSTINRGGSSTFLAIRAAYHGLPLFRTGLGKGSCYVGRVGDEERIRARSELRDPTLQAQPSEPGSRAVVLARLVCSIRGTYEDECRPGCRVRGRSRPWRWQWHARRPPVDVRADC